MEKLKPGVGTVAARISDPHVGAERSHTCNMVDDVAAEKKPSTHCDLATTILWRGSMRGWFSVTPAGLNLVGHGGKILRESTVVLIFSGMFPTFLRSTNEIAQTCRGNCALCHWQHAFLRMIKGACGMLLSGLTHAELICE